MNRVIRRITICVGLFLPALPAAGEGPKTAAGFIADGTAWRTPYYVADSGRAGPTVLVVAGMHGNEPAGPRAAEQIRHWPIVRGRLVVLPRANRPGLAAGVRHLPGRPTDSRDLNRNFPSAPGERPRGRPAEEIWRFVCRQRPDWVLDLHEGVDFHISHRPEKGKKRSAGSSIIYPRAAGLEELAAAMRRAADATVTDPARRFALLGGGPAGGSLVGACVKLLDAKGMILETTYRRQSISLRTRQHRAMVSVVLRRLGLLEQDGTGLLAAGAAAGPVAAGLYDAAGTGGKGVERITAILDAAPDITVHHVGPLDLRGGVPEGLDVLIFPGGSGSRQAEALGEAGREAVRRFVREGGGYLGICAGAYLCSAHYRWSLGLIDTRVFTGMRRVEGLGLKAMWYRGGSARVKMELTDAGRAMFPGIGRHVEVRYANGPIVSPKHDPALGPYTILAVFRSEKVLYPPQAGTMINTPAIVSGRFGRGRVVSVSPHPESTQGLESMVPAAVRWLAGRGEGTKPPPSAAPAGSDAAGARRSVRS